MTLMQKINGLKVRLEGYTPLRNFCIANFGKAAVVRQVFRHKAEIGLEEYPLILITRPRKNTTFAGSVPHQSHTVHLYCGFRYDGEDREKPMEWTIDLEELVEAAALTRAAGDVPMAIESGDSDNDEGMFHPIYFMVKRMEIKDR